MRHCVRRRERRSDRDLRIALTLSSRSSTHMTNELSLAHAPLTGDSFQWAWVLNVAAWLVVFAGGAIWRFRKDTARV